MEDDFFSGLEDLIPSGLSEILSNTKHSNIVFSHRGDPEAVKPIKDYDTTSHYGTMDNNFEPPMKKRANFYFNNVHHAPEIQPRNNEPIIENTSKHFHQPKIEIKKQNNQLNYTPIQNQRYVETIKPQHTKVKVYHKSQCNVSRIKVSELPFLQQVTHIIIIYKLDNSFNHLIGNIFILGV